MLGTLVVIAAAAALGMAFVTLAPNRLVQGTGFGLNDLVHGRRGVIVVPMLLLCIAIFMRPTRRTNLMVALAGSFLLVAFVWLAGDEAARLSAVAPKLSRVSLGGAFWVLLVVTRLAVVDALQRAGLGAMWRVVAGTAVVALVVGLVAWGELDQLSLLKEYANRQEVFHTALLRHLQIVGATLVPTLLIGVPLGWALFRSERFAPAAFAILNMIQTVPSIALFGLLIAPLALLVALWIHTQRVPRAHVMPPKGIAVAFTVMLIVLSLAKPAVSQSPAAPQSVPGSLAFDWVYLPVYPLIYRWSPATVWGLVGGATLLMLLAPWLPPKRRRRDEPFQFVIQPAGITIDVREAETLLDAGLRQGVALPFECRSGGCGACKATLIGGDVDFGAYQKRVLNDEERAGGKVLLCCATPLSDLEVECETPEQGATVDSRARPQGD